MGGGSSEGVGLQDWPRPLKLYAMICTLAGLGLLFVCALRLTWTDCVFVLAFAVGIGALEVVRFVFPSGEAMSVSSGLVLMVLWLFGPGAAMAADSLAMLAAGLFRRAPVRNMMFNIGQLVLSQGGAWLVFTLAGGRTGKGAFPASLPALLASGALFFLLNAAFMEGGLAIYKQASFWGLWWEILKRFWARWAVSLAFGIFLVAAYPYFGPVFLGLVLAFVGAQYFFLKKYAEGSQQSAVDSLLEMAADRDQYRPGHCDRVLRCAAALADELGLDQDEQRLVRYAALLHDVGMASVPRSMLLKSSALTAGERARIQQHPADGARLISRLAPLVPVARLVRHHHERYDGGGYPDALVGEGIPLGARILAAADAYDSLTVDQPHRPACTPRMALEELRRMSGTDFDPQVVEGLARVLEREGTLTPRAGQGLDEEIALTVRHLKEYVAGSRPAIRLPRPPPPATPAREEALLREIRQKAAGIVALYDLGLVINSSLSLEEVFALVTRTASRTLEAASALLLLDGQDSLEFQAAHGLNMSLPRPRLPAGEGPWGEALRAGRAASCADIAAVPLDPSAQAFLAQQRVRAVLCVPLAIKGQTTGVLAAFRESPQRFEEHEQNMLSIIASQATLAVENAKLYSETRDRLEQISAMKQFTDAVLENISTGIMVVSGENRVQLLNRAAQEMAAQRAEPAPAQGLEEPPLVKQLLGLDILADTLATGRQHYDGEVPVRLETRAALFEAQTTPLRDSRGRVTGAVMVFRDITEKKRLEEQVQQAQQMAMIGEIAAGAAHEIRNPLTSIRGFIQVLQERISAEGSEREYMDIVVDEIDRIDRLLQELMLLARPSLLKLVEFNLHQVLDEVCLLLRVDPASERVRVVKDYDCALPPMNADRSQLRQVLLNLLTNAFQAMPGGGEVTITTRHRPEAGEVEVSVRDTGVGIPPEVLPKIFTPFFTTKEHGTGMGLAVTFGIVRNHGGRIEVESVPGAGTTFTLRLPLDPATAPPPGPAGAAEE